MRRSALLAALVLLAPALAWANNPRLMGTLVRMDTKTGLIVIKTEAGNRAIQVQSSAKVEQNGSGSRLGNFHVGDPIEVEIGGTLSNDPLIGVAIYDRATAAALPPPEQPDGVYGEPVGTLASVAGSMNLARPSDVTGGLAAGGGTPQNLATIMNQNPMGPSIGQPEYGPLAVNPNAPFAAPNQYTGAQYSQQGPMSTQQAPQQQGGWQQPPSSMPPQQAGTGGWQQPPNTAPQQQQGGWQSAPPPPPAAGTIGQNNGWTASPGSGWSSNGTMGQVGTVDGVIRNIDPARAMLFVQPANGAATVAVKISIDTPVQNQQAAAVPLNQIRLGSYVHVVGYMAGNTLTARSINITQ